MTALAAIAAETLHDRVLLALEGARLELSTESRLQAAIALRLASARLVYMREQRLVEHGVTFGRIDFLLDGVGLEIKIGGQARAVLRQLEEYARCSHVRSLILATSKPFAMPASLNGKRLSVVDLSRGWL